MEGFFFYRRNYISFIGLSICFTKIDAENKAPELAQTSKKHSFSEFAERVLFVYLALAMLDRCIPVAPRLFPRQKQSEVHTIEPFVDGWMLSDCWIEEMEEKSKPVLRRTVSLWRRYGKARTL